MRMSKHELGARAIYDGLCCRMRERCWIDAIMKVRTITVAIVILAGWLDVQASSQSPNPARNSEPIRGRVVLGSGEKIGFAYYFNQNALKDGVAQGDALFALTDSGNLMRFDSGSLKLTGQAIVPGRGTALAAGPQGDVLVGTQEGNLYRIHPTSFDLERIASFKGRIAWIGTSNSSGDRNGRIVAVVDNSADVLPWPGEANKAYESRSLAAALRVVNPYQVAILENGKTRALPFPPLSNFSFPGYFMLDSQDRLWFGSDNGEWGGQCAYMNLRTGRGHKLHSEMEGVLGFLRASDERILIYGGMSHMGANSGYISEIKDGEVVPLVNVEHNDWQYTDYDRLPKPIAQALKSTPHLDNMPNGPIDLLVNDEGEKGFWVVSAHELYHADEQFRQWEKIVNLGGRWEGGRRLSMGNTPTINRLLVDPDRPKSLIVIMGRDGLERVTATNVESFSFVGSLEAPVIEIWNTSLGTALLEPDDRNGGHAPWLLKDDQWRRYSLFPDQLPSGEGAVWYFAEPFGNDEDRISAFDHGNVDPGKAYLVQLDDAGVAKVLDSWDGDDSEFETNFLTSSDGTVLKATGKELFIRRGGGWMKVGLSQLEWPTDRKSVMGGRNLVLLGRDSRSDYFLATELGDIFQLQRPEGLHGEYRLIHATYPKHETPVQIFDASPDQDGWVLLSTARGLLHFNLESGVSKTIQSPNPDQEIKSLCRDNQGRLWAVGDYLYLSPDEGKHWDQIKLPMLTRTYTKRIRPNPANPRQMTLTLEDMGAVILEWHL